MDVARQLLILFAVAVLVFETANSQDMRGTVNIEPHTFKTLNGQTVEAELGKLFVPENRSNPSSRLIELTFLRLKRTGGQPGIPILYLVGGPGASAINQAKGIGFPFYNTLREAGDFIILEQRGTANSKPNLECKEPLNYPLDRQLETGELLRLTRDQCRRCAEHWRAQGADLTGYNTNENADDVEALRQALGINKLNLFGTSYGTHLSLAVIRRHGHNLNRVIVAGVEGPDHTYKLPGNIQKHFEDIAQIYKADPRVGKLLPDFIGQMRAVLDKLDKQPVIVEVTDSTTNQKANVKIGKLDLQLFLTTLPGRVARIKSFPATFAAMNKGDYSALAQFSILVRRESNISAMSYLMDCASHGSPERLKRIQREASSSLVGSLMDFPFPEVCEAWGARDAGPLFRSALKSNLPVLFISGTLDGRTPVSNAEEVRKGFSNSFHLIIEQAGHVDTTMFVPDTVKAMLAFFATGELSTSRITQPPLEFSPLSHE
jgi:pimeloyl-ACP methyl ester carboxylesterase